MKRTSCCAVVWQSCCIIAATCSVVAGQTDAPCGQPWNTPLATVEGTIKNVYYAVPPGTRKEGLHLGVETSSGEYVVIHVFPKQCIASNPNRFKFAKGDAVTAVGSEFSTQKGGQQLNICASEIPDHGFAGDSALRDAETGSLNTGLCRNCQARCKGKPQVECCMKACEEGKTMRPEECMQQIGGNNGGGGNSTCEAMCKNKPNYQRCMQGCGNGRPGGGMGPGMRGPGRP